MTITGTGTTAAYTRELFGEVDWLWICDDIETSDSGRPLGWAAMHRVVDHIDASPLEDVVVSTQLQVGSCATLEQMYPDRRFGVIPENFRTTQHRPQVDRFVIGTRSDELWRLVRRRLFRYWCIFMDPESAEMVKHGLNGFLALSVQYSQELADLAVSHGADPKQVAAGIQSDPRIGKRSYLQPDGKPGPHLSREVHTLSALGGGPLIDVLEERCSQ
jgi:UDPglucose 6-dehydrogenase